MNKINLYNYEAYFLDYAEGNLDAVQMQELRLFLELHPELEKDLLDFQGCELLPIPSQITFPGKHSLIRDEEYHLTELEMLVIGKIENTLHASEELYLGIELANPSVQQELEIYRKTILKENKNILFSRKNRLKRHNKSMWIKYAAAAVSISIALFWFSSLQNSQLEQNLGEDKLPFPSAKEESKANPEQGIIMEVGKTSSPMQLADSRVEENLPTEVLERQEIQLDPTQSKSWKKLPMELDMEPIAKMDINPAILKLDVEVKPANEEYASIPDLLKDQVKQKILKNTVKFELPDDEKSKGFAFSLGGFELSHSSN